MSAAIDGARPVLLFFAAGVPAPQGSKNAYRRGSRVVQVEASKALPAWRSALVLSARALWPSGQHPLDVAVTVDVEFVRPRPKALGKKPTPRLVATPDLDKLCRSVGDALVIAGVLNDDNLIDRWVASKRYAELGEKPGARVAVYTHPVRLRLEAS